MSVQRIHVAYEQLLGQPVVYGTVRDWLSDNAKTDKVTRVKHGIYRLKRKTVTASDTCGNSGNSGNSGLLHQRIRVLPTTRNAIRATHRKTTEAAAPAPRSSKRASPPSSTSRPAAAS